MYLCKSSYIKANLMGQITPGVASLKQNNGIIVRQVLRSTLTLLR